MTKQMPNSNQNNAILQAAFPLLYNSENRRHATLFVHPGLLNFLTRISRLHLSDWFTQSRLLAHILYDLIWKLIALSVLKLKTDWL